MSHGSGCLGLAPAQTKGIASVEYAVSGHWLEVPASGRSLMVTIVGFATISRFQRIPEENAGMTL